MLDECFIIKFRFRRSIDYYYSNNGVHEYFHCREFNPFIPFNHAAASSHVKINASFVSTRKE